MLEFPSHICLFSAPVMSFTLRKKSAPVVITVPHDSILHKSDWEGLLMEREKGINGRDKNVWPIARDIMQATENVSVVRGNFPRNLIDYNRAIDDKKAPACIDHRLNGYYYGYHYAVGHFVEVATQSNKKSLLLDIHGFQKQPKVDNGNYDIILGTCHRETIAFDSSIDKDLFDDLSSCGYKVYLPGKRQVRGEKYIGSYTIQHYSHMNKKQRHYIDAIQMEIAPRFRAKDGKKEGERLSSSIASFIERYFD